VDRSEWNTCPQEDKEKRRYGDKKINRPGVINCLCCSQYMDNDYERKFKEKFGL
jgi:hypothetical protein